MKYKSGSVAITPNRTESACVDRIWDKGWYCLIDVAFVVGN